MNIDIERFKQKLSAEKDVLEQELSAMGVRDPQNPDNWEAAVLDTDTHDADKNVQADKVEDFIEQGAALNQLEIRLKNVRQALQDIESGSYGTCKVCGAAIEVERLEANAAAATCKQHLNEEPA
jgi:RNA polymerase-binding transcription factor DksA